MSSKPAISGNVTLDSLSQRFSTPDIGGGGVNMTGSNPPGSMGRAGAFGNQYPIFQGGMGGSVGGAGMSGSVGGAGMSGSVGGAGTRGGFGGEYGGCSVCGLFFSKLNGELEAHQKSHDRNTPKLPTQLMGDWEACQFCGQNFNKSTGDLQLHQLTTHYDKVT